MLIRDATLQVSYRFHRQHGMVEEVKRHRHRIHVNLADQT